MTNNENERTALPRTPSSADLFEEEMRRMTGTTSTTKTAASPLPEKEDAEAGKGNDK